MNIDKKVLKSNGYFGIIEEPVPHKQHQNQQEGLDLYIKVLNFSTGEECFKKMYKNTKGLHFKHSGNSYWKNHNIPSTHYLDDFNKEVLWVPYQVIELKDNNE